MAENRIIDPLKISNEIRGKYTLTNNSFKMVAKDNPKDLVEAIIGDDKQLDFMPQVKIQRWDNEVNFSVRLVDDELTKPTITTVKDKIVWTNVEKDIKFYDISPNEEHPEGGYEFEVILKEKPKSNVVSFTLNTKGLDFFYQPPLTQKEIDEGAVRPENVVGSYAVYASENKTNYVGGKEYKCGKVGHIFRPKIIDAKGTETWGDLNVDVENGILSVAIPQGFLDNAVYPVRHAAGLTFGYTGVGGSGSISASADIYGTKFTAPSAGTVQKFTVYAGLSGPPEFGDAYIKGVLVLHSDHNIVTNGVGSAASFSTTGWKDSTFSTNPDITAVDYDLCWIGTGSASGPVVWYDNGDANMALQDTSNNYTTPTNPTDGNHTNNYKFSIYATYLASGTFPVRESVTDTDFASSVTSMAVNMPATVNAGDRLIALCHVRNAGTWTTVPADWSKLGEQAGGGSVGELSIFEKIAVGNEDSGTATWVTGTGTTAAWQVIRVSGAHASTASEVTTASGDSSSANPPSESASWGGSENNLWIAVAGHSAASTTAFSAAPIGFLGFAQNGASSGGSAVCVAHGYDNYAGDTYDPGTFTPSGSNRWWASATIVVRPAASVSTAVKDMLGGFIPFAR